jgi:hypothetical protein
MYDPQLGRFLSADSINPDPLNGQAFDRYAYTYNNLLNATDPSGHASGEAQDGGMPCWGCSGEGWATGDDGTPVAATLLGFTTVSILRNAGTPNATVETYTGRVGDLGGFFEGIAQANAANGMGTTIDVNLPGIFNGTFLFKAVGGGVGEGDDFDPQISWSLGSQVTVETNGGSYFYNSNQMSSGNPNGWMSYPIGPLSQSYNGPLLTLQQMNRDIMNFRQTATDYYLKTADTEDKDLGIDTFMQSPTYQWTQRQSDSAINQLGIQLIQDIANNPMPSWPSWFNSTNQDVDRLTEYVKTREGI